MKLIVYNAENEVINVVDNMEKVEIEGNNVYWHNGSMVGVKANFIVIDDTTETPSQITDTVITLDRKQEFIKVDLLEENKRLKERLTTTENALLDLMDRL